MKFNEIIKNHEAEKVKAVEEAKAAMIKIQTSAKGRPGASS